MRIRQALRVRPRRILKFMGPYNVNRSIEIEMSNPGKHNMAWRLMGTAPWRYHVTPSAGIILAGDGTNVQITVRHDRLSPQMTEDKFKLQNFFLPDDTMDAASIWHQISVKMLMQTRFYLHFAMPVGPGNVPHNIHYEPDAPLPKLWLGPGARHFRHLSDTPIHTPAVIDEGADTESDDKLDPDDIDGDDLSIMSDSISLSWLDYIEENALPRDVQVALGILIGIALFACFPLGVFFYFIP